jgi:hypothetical protein
MSGRGCRDCRGYSYGRALCDSCVVKCLEARVLSLVEKLLPNGKYDPRRREYQVGSLAGEAGKSLGIAIGGRKNGRWIDRNTKEKGNLLGLIAALCCHGDRIEALRWGLRWLGEPEGQRPARPLPVHAPDDDIKTRGIAERIWEKEGVPVRRGDWIVRYLAESRGIPLERLAWANGGKLPDVLRFHARLWNRETSRFYPAMIAKIVGLDGQFLGIHRTWLSERGGRVDKAPIEDPKMTLGRFSAQGGCIRLWGPRWSEATDEDTLGLSEGIEDGLSAALLYPSWRIAAGVSSDGLMKIRIPPVFGRIALITQNNKPGSSAAPWGAEVRERFLCEGREVWLLNVPREVKDLNELLVKFGKRPPAIARPG